MEFRILGPLEVRGEHGEVALGGRKPRAVLAVLLLNANEPVSAERLAVALWGEDVPGAAVKTVQVHVSRLRKALGGGEMLATTPAGYCLHVGPGELDAERFTRMVEDGRRTLECGEAEQASHVLREALTLWRGRPLAELVSEPFAQAEIARLEEQRLGALETRLEADLAAGRHDEVVAELQQLVAEHPTREQLVEHLMLALYRCGRQAEALEAYRDARNVLVEEIGVEPRPQLRDLHDAVLHQDPALDPPPPELPTELDPTAATPLVGRDAILDRLRRSWEAARSGAGTVVALTGEPGSGKTRLAAELAGAVHRRGATVLSAAGTEPSRLVFGAVAHAREARGPTLLVLDDADRAAGEVRAELSEQVRAAADGPVLAIVTGRDTDALAELGGAETLALEPLDSAAVHEIALLYAAPGTAEDIPDEWLLEASAGVPRRVHELAGQWGRREAARRVKVVADRTETDRADLRSLEVELAGSVVELEATRQRSSRLGAERAALCPFKGLASFGPADAPYFFGREHLVAQLVARLVGAPALGVVGPSGSGKSSVVQAGLLPALSGGALPGSEHWEQAVLRPGEHPMRALRRATEHLDDTGRVVLAVDQFEEVFTACRDEVERARFIAELVRLADANAVLVIAIRADQYGHCADYPRLSALLSANQVLVGAMRRDELRRAIECPAEQAGLRVDSELPDALLADVEGQPGALPLLSAALLELWQRREGRWLTKGAYERTGGVHGAVARLADDAFRQLDPDQQVLARRVLLALVAEGNAGTVERRRVPLAELEVERRDDVGRIVSVLADHRLLTLSDETVELAHEALLREWPRLSAWIDEDRERIRIHRTLRAAAEQWLARDRNEDWLYRGSHLLEAEEREEFGDLGLAGFEREFLAASRARADRERTARRRLVGIGFAALAVGLVAITVIALVAIGQRQDAERERNLAVSRELALQSGKMLNADPELAVRLALLALDKAPTVQAAAALRQAVPAFHPYTSLTVDPNDANAAAYSPDGRRLVTGGARGAAIWDVATHRAVARLPTGDGAVAAARFSPAGDRVALGFEDGTVTVTGASLGAPRGLLRATGAKVGAVAFSGDGKRLAAALGDGTVRVLATDGSGSDIRLTGHKGAVLGVDISRDGTRVASAGKDGRVQLWNLAGGGAGQVLHDGDLPEADVAFSPDGSRLMAVGDDRRIRFWDARTGAAQPSVSGEGRELSAAAFSADGRRFAAGGREGTPRVWSAEGGAPVAVLRGQHARILDLGFGPTSDRVVAAADDGSVRLWDAGRTQAWTVPSPAYDAQFNRDGRLIATGSQDGTARVWNPRTGELRASLDGPDGVTVAQFSPTADTVLITNSSQARLWPIAAQSATVAIQLPKGRTMLYAEFDGTGRRLVYTDDAGNVVVRDLVSGRDTRLEGGPKKLYGAFLSPDGRYVVAVPDRDLVVWRVDRPSRPVAVLRGHRGTVNTVDINRENLIATGGGDGTLRMWDTAGHQRVTIRGFADEVTTVVFTADGRQALASAQDGSLRLFDVRTGTVLAAVRSAEGELYDVALSRDGNIATLGRGDVVRVFPCDVCGSLERVRGLALSRSPRQLTANERKQFLAAAR